MIFDDKVEANHQEDHENDTSAVEKGVDGGLNQCGPVLLSSPVSAPLSPAASLLPTGVGVPVGAGVGVGMSGVTITGVAVGGSEVGVMVGVGETSVVGVGEGRALPTKTRCVVNSS